VGPKTWFDPKRKVQLIVAMTSSISIPELGMPSARKRTSRSTLQDHIFPVLTPPQCAAKGMLLARSGLQQRTAQPWPLPLPRPHLERKRFFHPSPSLHDDSPGMPDHYATLDLPTNASAGEIKKQFYKLSKEYHPDLHPNDPSKAQRFVKISEAHATLGSPEKKARYDRDFFRSASGPTGVATQHPSGRHSSYAGSRPASGLSKRRTQFRGPPPSFYRSGGWGQHSEKRAEHATKASHSHEAQGRAQSGPGGHAGPAGTGPGGFAMGYDNDVRHFDHLGHYRTHSDIERTRHKARRKVVQDAEEEYEGGNSTLFNFFMLSGMLGVVFITSGVIWGLSSDERRKGRREGDTRG
jgi:hypothetical protein